MSKSEHMKHIGEPLKYDPEFRGPVSKRGCTDVFFLLLFITFIGGWVIVSIFSIRYGNPEQIIYPSDSYGRICGRNELNDKPYLHFFNILECAKVVKSFSKGCDTPQVCVDKCPDYTVSFAPYRYDSNFTILSIDEKKQIQDRLICLYNVNIKNRSLDEIPAMLRENKCALFYFNSTKIAGRCVPIAFKSFKVSGGDDKGIKDDLGRAMIDEKKAPIKEKSIYDANVGIVITMQARAAGEKIFHDLIMTWKYIAVFLLIAMIVSFIWIMLMQIFAGLMIWFSVVAAVVVTGFGVYFCFARYTYLGSLTEEDLKEKESNVDVTKVNFFTLFKVQYDSFISNRTFWIVLSIISSIVFVIMFLSFIFLRKRINIAISLIKEASKAISSAKSSLFFPIIPYLCQFAIILWWGGVAILISASGKKQYRIFEPNTTDNPLKTENGLTCNPLTYNSTTGRCEFYQFYSSDILNYAQLYNLFVTLWVLFFISGFCQVALAGAFSSYYWSFNKPDDVPSFPVITGASRALRYHMGSIALGSLLLATVRFIRIIIEYIENKCKKYAGNAIAKSILCLCRCCFWCLESFLKFINTNAYIMIAIYGESFCSSAHKAFMLLLRNILRVLVIDKVADYLLFLGKLLVTAFMGILSFYYFSNKFELNFVEPPLLNYNWAPVAAICFGTYFIACSFFSVYDMCVDTIFLCFLEDCERNDGSSSKPYFMSKELMEILQYKNKLDQTDND